MEFHIRAFEDRDTEAVKRLHEVALRGTGAHPDDGEWDKDLDCIPEVYQHDGGCFLVGEAEGRIVVMGALKRVDDELAEVKRMRVHPDWQRHGLGSEMLRRLEEAARRRGYLCLTLETTTLQTAAQGLYEKHGYKKTGGRVILGFDTFIYEKEINEEGSDI